MDYHEYIILDFSSKEKKYFIIMIKILANLILISAWTISRAGMFEIFSLTSLHPAPGTITFISPSSFIYQLLYLPAI